MIFTVKERLLDFNGDLHRIYQLLVAHGYVVDLEACMLIWLTWSRRFAEEDLDKWVSLPPDDETLLVILVSMAQQLSFDTPGFELGGDESN